MITTNSLVKLKHVESAGVILRPNSPEIKKIYSQIKTIFKNANINLVLEKTSATMIEEEGFEFEELCKISDFLVSIGGDGTLISVVRRSFKYDIAVLGIHLGTLGFLTDITLEDLPLFLEKLKEGKYRIDERMMIQGNVNNSNFVAFNDIVISRKSVTNMLRVDARINEKLFNSYYGDGLIISTPTGSTAYNLSAGGPVVFPLTNAFIVTPVAAHSLTQRPLILPADFEIEFLVTDSLGAIVIVDGQDIYEVNEKDSIRIKIASKKAKLIHRQERDYFEVLNKKLQWGN